MNWGKFLLFIVIGFAAQIIDGTLGMAYGVSCRTFLKTVAGLPSALASAVVHVAEVPPPLASGLSHIKLKNVEVAYTFRNARWMRKAHIGSIRVFVNANNLCTWGGKDLIDGIDPELVQDGSTSEGIIYPLTRVYNFGFNIQF